MADSRGMTVSILPDASSDRMEWDAYVMRARQCSVYHLYAWKEIIETTFGHRTFYLAARGETNDVVGVLPLVELKSRLFGRMLASLPFFNYGGVCARDEGVRRSLMEAAVQIAKQNRADFIELRQEEQGTDDLPMKQSKVSMRLELPATADELWKGLGSKLRNQVQRPRKEGMRVLFGGEDLLADFYAVFSTNMRDLGTPVYPRTFFRNILNRFPLQARIAVVYMNSLPLAAGFLIGFKERIEIPWASSLRAYNVLNPNMLLYWSCLEFACSHGFTQFDFGRSTPGGGTFRFKEQWGARPFPLYWHYWLPRGGSLPEVNPTNPKYRAAIAVWRRLPLTVTHWLGPQIVKYIP
jgi:FemAB-related protein (PEP-CTERM system-associated)